jgi:hypothetical protein
MSSGYTRLRRPAVCSGEQPRARCVLTYCHSQGARSWRVRVGDAPELPPASVPYRHDRAGPSPCCGQTRGSRCWGPAPTPKPSSATNGRGPAPGSGSYGLRHSSACSISLAWQHLRPSGPAVLHLELELRPPKPGTPPPKRG